MSEIRAPWTAEQVKALNENQHAGWMHPFTCANRSTGHPWREGETDFGILVATTEGWVCRDCEYTQDWAHVVNG